MRSEVYSVSSVKQFCYFCQVETEFLGDRCQTCHRIDGELYCPMTFDNCRICNKRIIIATGEQPIYLKNGYCSNRCAGEWSQGTGIEYEAKWSK